MNFIDIKVASTMLSVVLWVMAGRLWASTQSILVFFIVGILALLAQVIGVNAAFKEGRRTSAD